jgi:hypothetical protein
MLTIATYWIASSYAIGIALVVDQLRRPQAEWEAAGRNRRFWVALSLILGFHALGQYAAIGYLVGVVPRFRAAGPTAPRRALARLSAAVTARGRGATPARRERTAGEELALAAAVLIFASGFIHSALIVDHFEEYWLFGVFFAVVTCTQALWTALLYLRPRDRRILLAGAIGNAFVAGVWLISRTTGTPFGPRPWEPATAGVMDVIATMDEVAAVVLLLAAAGVRRITGTHLRLASMTAGCLLLFSFLAGYSGDHGH